jgi:hypothetical protein
MNKNLLYLLLILSGATFLQGKTGTPQKQSNVFFCDTLAPVNIQAIGITLTSATISWTNDPNTAQYTVRYRMYGSSTWSTITSVGQNQFTLTGLMPCTAYEVQVAKNCNTIGSFSAPVVFSTYLNYCSAASVDSGVVHISNVTVTPVGGLAQMVSNSGTSVYTDYRPDPTRKVQLMLGSTGNLISVSKTWSGTSGIVSVRAWIDFNADGIFQSSEMMLTSNSSAAPTVTSLFNVPAFSFQTGTNCGVAMRVITSETYTSPVCGTFTYGEVEDYGVSILTSANLSVKETNTAKTGSIYPNPSSDILNLSGIAGNEFDIYNQAGQKVKKGKISDQKIDIRELIPGVYFLEIRDGMNITRLKFIRNK